MRIKFIEQWKFRLFGRAVPVVKAEDITDNGIVCTLHLLGDVKKRANSMISTWDAKGWEIDRYSSKITLIDEKGLSKSAYVVSDGGKTINLYTNPILNPNLEDVIGHAATMDDIADAMDLGKSMRNIVIGMLIGICIGWWFVAPIVSGMMK
jgi:hypothetical protein